MAYQLNGCTKQGLHMGSEAGVTASTFQNFDSNFAKLQIKLYNYATKVSLGHRLA
jgi:hypothetical protein